MDDAFGDGKLMAEIRAEWRRRYERKRSVRRRRGREQRMLQRVRDLMKAGTTSAFRRVVEVLKRNLEYNASRLEQIRAGRAKEA